MTLIQHCIDALPISDSVVRLKRNEELLLTTPEASAAPLKLWQDYERLSVTNLPQRWQAAKFAPPRDVFVGDCLRLEWQQMDNRQPFYHRNADVDEISYQVTGERTLMTELGTIELRPGDYSRIPVGIAHDNYGRKEVHLLIYVLAPAEETGSISSQAEVIEVPFEGWTAKPHTIEMMTECLGALGCDVSVSLADERLLLGAGVEGTAPKSQQLLAQRATVRDNMPEWLYKTRNVWIGSARHTRSDGMVYHTHRRAVAIHYQITGERTLVTQRGTVQMLPGDFIRIPIGCAYTSLHKEESEHIIVLTTDRTLVMKAPGMKQADSTQPKVVIAMRSDIQNH